MVDEAGRALYKAAHGPAAREFQAVMQHDRGHDRDEGATCRRCRRKRSGRGLNGATLPETSLVRL